MRRPAARVLLARCAPVLVATTAVAATGAGARAFAQEGSTDPGVHVASVDVGLGAAFVRGTETAVSYGAGTDVAGLLVPGATTRFGFRFWSAEDPVRIPAAPGAAPGGAVDVVELDDFAVSIMARTRFIDAGISLYGGIGPSLHIVSARFQSDISREEDRDGLRPGLDAQLGVGFPITSSGFASIFAEATGSLVDRLSHLGLYAGLRLRFDRLEGRPQT